MNLLLLHYDNGNYLIHKACGLASVVRIILRSRCLTLSIVQGSRLLLMFYSAGVYALEIFILRKLSSAFSPFRQSCTTADH